MRYCHPPPSVSPHLWQLEISEDISIHVTEMTCCLSLHVPKRQSPLSPYNYTKQAKTRYLGLQLLSWLAIFQQNILGGMLSALKIESHWQQYYNFEEIFEKSTRQKSHSSWQDERFPSPASKSLLHLGESRVWNPRCSTASGAELVRRLFLSKDFSKSVAHPSRKCSIFSTTPRS